MFLLRQKEYLDRPITRPDKIDLSSASNAGESYAMQ